MHPGLRIADAGVPVAKTLAAAGRGVKLRAGQLLQPRDAADMVEMLVAVQEDFHVAELEAELPRCCWRSRSAPASVPASIRICAVVSGDQD